MVNSISAFRDNPSVPSSRIKKSLRNYHCTLRNVPEERDLNHHFYWLRDYCHPLPSAKVVVVTEYFIAFYLTIITYILILS